MKPPREFSESRPSPDSPPPDSLPLSLSAVEYGRIEDGSNDGNSLDLHLSAGNSHDVGLVLSDLRDFGGCWRLRVGLIAVFTKLFSEGKFDLHTAFLNLGGLRVYKSGVGFACANEDGP